MCCRQGVLPLLLLLLLLSLPMLGLPLQLTL
jgi:hypothetical protein